MNVQIEESWKEVLAPEFEKDYFVKLTDLGIPHHYGLSSGTVNIQRL